MYRVVFDTNVLLSAFVFGGNPQKLFELARKGDLKLLVSSSMVLEFATILKDKFSWGEAAISDAVKTIGYSSISVKPTTRIKVISDDADNRILECAVEGKADFIASGDHHLLEFGRFESIRIVAPSELLAILTADPP